MTDINNKSVTAVLKFRIFGNMRYLSHAEGLRLFRRAIRRVSETNSGEPAQIDVAYSAGFNPRPQISLPLPRTVGLACEDETCCVKLNRQTTDTQSLKEKMNKQMPQGIEVMNLRMLKGGSSFTTGTAVYELPLITEAVSDKLKERAGRLPAAGGLKVQRRSKKSGKIKTVDVGRFLESVKLEDSKIIVKVKFSPEGSIRVDELLDVFGLDGNKLAGPVKRTKIIWA